MRLSELKAKQTAIIRQVLRTADGGTSLSDLVANRLETLGFVPGYACAGDYQRYFWW